MATRTHGKEDFGPEALRDLPRDYLRWFDYWLKGVDNGVLKEPLVSVFVMNTNKWLYGPKYPLPQTRFEKWYLASGGKANTSLGDGKLTREPPGRRTRPADRYSYDPGDPTSATPTTSNRKRKRNRKRETGKMDKDEQEADKAKPRRREKEAAKDRREELTKSRPHERILVYVCPSRSRSRTRLRVPFRRCCMPAVPPRTRIGSCV